MIQIEFSYKTKWWENKAVKGFRTLLDIVTIKLNACISYAPAIILLRYIPVTFYRTWVQEYSQLQY